jgi:hypothetical protein
METYTNFVYAFLDINSDIFYIFDDLKKKR